MSNKTNTKRELVRIGKTLNEILLVKDSAGNLIHRAVKPLMVELRPHDIMQLIIGATILSVPVTFTEEVWKLGQTLPWINIILLCLVSITFVGLFVYYNFYRNHFKAHRIEFIKRIIAIYVISLSISFLILFLLDKTPLTGEWPVTFKRMVLVSFPASMSAVVADMIK